MANYMKEVAKMFGVELGEYFKVYDEEMNYPFDYYFSNHGLMVDKGASILEANGVLRELLLGRYKIRRHPCKPNNQESYWYVDKKGNICADYWNDENMYSINLYKLGNCYFSYEDAKADRDKWIAFYSSENVLDI